MILLFPGGPCRTKGKKKTSFSGKQSCQGFQSVCSLGLQSHAPLSRLPWSYSISLHALLPAWIFINMCQFLSRSHTFSAGSAIESDHGGRFMPTGRFAFTAEQFLSPGKCYCISPSASACPDLDGTKLTKGPRVITVKSLWEVIG